MSVIGASQSVTTSRAYDRSTRGNLPQSASPHLAVSRGATSARTSSRRCGPSWAWLMRGHTAIPHPTAHPGGHAPPRVARRNATRSTRPLTLRAPLAAA